MRSSYSKEDVIFLLKDITGLVEPQPASERERLIQSGKHYCEMLPLEYVPSELYMKTYQEALRHFAGPVKSGENWWCWFLLPEQGRPSASFCSII